MRILLFTFLMAVASVNIHAQNVTPQDIKVGDVLEIGKPDMPQFKHIDFPRANFIIKKGGIADFKKVVGNKVVVTEIQETKDGVVEVKLKKTDGKRFFNSHSVVKANLINALESGELSVL